MDEATKNKAREDIMTVVSRTFDGSLGEDAGLIVISVTGNDEVSRAGAAVYKCSFERVVGAVKSLSAAYAERMVGGAYASALDDAEDLANLALKVVESGLKLGVDEGIESVRDKLKLKKEAGKDGRNDEA